MMDNKDKMALRRYGRRFDECGVNTQAKIERALAQPIRSADRVVLVHGVTRVFTNNLDRGVVDLSRLSYDWHAGEKRWVPWFDVDLDTDYKGNPTSGKEMQSDDRVAVRFNGKSA